VISSASPKRIHMKKNFLLIIVFTVFVSVNFAEEISWFKTFKGKIGSSTVTMNLVKYNDEVKGYYYYDKYMIPMTIFGTLENDSLQLIAYFNSYDTEYFKGILKKADFSGKWNNDHSKVNDFELEEDPKLSKEFEFVFVKGNKKLFNTEEYSPYAEYVEGTIWPRSSYGSYTVLRHAILNEKKFPSGTGSPGELMLKNKNAYIENFLEENKNFSKDDIADLGFSYSLIDHDVMIPAYFDDNIFVFSRYWYNYSGGAHGNFGTQFRNFDLKKNKFLELNDILATDGIKALPGLLEKYYRIQNNVDPSKSLMDDGLFSDTIHVNENFMITPGGLTFDFVPYEIAPYAGGELVIYIPVNEITAHLKPRGKELVKQ
jgi:hypothetical protein